MRAPFVYMLVMVSTAIVFAYVGLITAMTVRAMKCDQSEHPDDAFVMYCNSVEFADYEHGAFFYEYEPRAIDAMKKADVMFLGNSRMMYAMTADYSDTFMKDHQINYYQFGFGYGQLSDFPLALIRRFKPQPKVLIINADPFFLHSPSGPAKGMLSGSLITRLEYIAKRTALPISRALCEAMPRLCRRQGAALYRGYETGRWRLLLPTDHQSYPLDTTPFTPEVVERTAQVAEEFLAALPTPRECVILTGIPSPYVNPQFTTALAKRLGAVNINVIPKKLMTRDQNHVDLETALAWQKEFLPKALPTIQKCLRK